MICNRAFRGEQMRLILDNLTLLAASSQVLEMSEMYSTVHPVRSTEYGGIVDRRNLVGPFLVKLVAIQTSLPGRSSQLA